MEALERNKVLIEDNTEAIRASVTRLVDTAKSANKDMADATGKVRDGCDKLSAAIDKFMKVAGRQEFEKSVATTVLLVQALEKLAALEERGLLDRVMRSLAANK